MLLPSCHGPPLSRGHDAFVQALDPARACAKIETIDDVLRGHRDESRGFAVSPDQTLQSRLDRIDATRWHEQAVRFVTDDLGAATDVRREHGLAHAGGLQEDVRQSFRVGRQGEHVDTVVNRSHVGHVPQESDTVRDSQLPCESSERLAIRSIPGKDELHGRVLAREACRGPKEIRLTLLAAQPTNVADQTVVFMEAP